MAEEHEGFPRLTTFHPDEAARFSYWARRHGMRPYATTALIIANVWVFVLMGGEAEVDARALFLTGVGMEQLLIDLGALLPFSQAREEPWRFATATALHASGVHLFLNMLGLMCVGSALEWIAGSRRVLWVYGASALGGTVASAMVLTDGAISVGASGAILGVASAVVVSLLHRRRQFPFGVLWMVMPLLLLLGGVLFILPLLTNILDHAQHWGGCVVGGCVALLPASRKGVARSLVGVVTLGFLVTSVSLPLALTLQREGLGGVLPGMHESWRSEPLEKLRLTIDVPRSWKRSAGRDGLPLWHDGRVRVLVVRFEAAPALGMPSPRGHVDLLLRDYQQAQIDGELDSLEVLLKEDLDGVGPGGLLVGLRMEVRGRPLVDLYRLLELPHGAARFQMIVTNVSDKSVARARRILMSIAIAE